MVLIWTGKPFRKQSENFWQSGKYWKSQGILAIFFLQFLNEVYLLSKFLYLLNSLHKTLKNTGKWKKYWKSRGNLLVQRCGNQCLLPWPPDMTLTSCTGSRARVYEGISLFYYILEMLFVLKVLLITRPWDMTFRSQKNGQGQIFLFGRINSTFGAQFGNVLMLPLMLLIRKILYITFWKVLNFK